MAHHQVAVNGRKLILHSAQARKLLKRIKDLKPAPAKAIGDINKWVEAARDAYEQGQNVLVVRTIRLSPSGKGRVPPIRRDHEGTKR